MKIVLNFDVLKIMFIEELEDYCNVGEDFCCELSYVVMCDLMVLDGWVVNVEYWVEFGGFFFVQFWFSLFYDYFDVVVCSLGDFSFVWIIVFIICGGQFFFVVCLMVRYNLEWINYVLFFIVCFDEDGYLFVSIINILKQEGE